MVLTGRFGFGVFISCVVWFVFGLLRGVCCLLVWGCVNAGLDVVYLLCALGYDLSVMPSCCG